MRFAPVQTLTDGDEKTTGNYVVVLRETQQYGVIAVRYVGKNPSSAEIVTGYELDKETEVKQLFEDWNGIQGDFDVEAYLETKGYDRYGNSK